VPLTPIKNTEKAMKNQGSHFFVIPIRRKTKNTAANCIKIDAIEMYSVSVINLILL
jgi:hypothetical protein